MSKKKWNFGHLDKPGRKKLLKIVERFSKEDLDNDVFLMFGTLLGAVREGDLIKHDNDIDVCYLSKYNNKADVRREAVELFNKLRDEGLLVKYWNIDYLVGDLENITSAFGQAHIMKDGFLFDLFTAWVDEKGRLNTCQWGDIGEFKGLKQKQLLGCKFKIPKNYDDILTHLYGNWRVPSDTHPSQNGLVRDCYLKGGF